jgi:hypothetical protein
VFPNFAGVIWLKPRVENSETWGTFPIYPQIRSLRLTNAEWNCGNRRNTLIYPVFRVLSACTDGCGTSGCGSLRHFKANARLPGGALDPICACLEMPQRTDQRLRWSGQDNRSSASICARANHRLSPMLLILNFVIPIYGWTIGCKMGLLRVSS